MEPCPIFYLLGNGINRAFELNSWDELLAQVSRKNLSEEEKKAVERMPYPMQAVIVTDDRVHENLEQLADALLNTKMSAEQLGILRDYLRLRFDAVLTTNYTYEIENAIDDKFYCKKRTASKYRFHSKDGTKAEEQFGIYKYMKVSDGEFEHRIWHVHGETARPRSMILGHYYYGKLLSNIQQYVSNVIRQYESARKEKRDYQPYSWIDYFLIGNVYIVGYGMDLSEIDIWWLINCRKKNMQKCGKIYYIEPNMNVEKNVAKRLLAEVYGLDIITEVVEEDYMSYYKNAINNIKK